MGKIINDLQFIWDDHKEELNIQKHHLSFSIAARVFQDPYRIEIWDQTHSLYEDRFNTIGSIGCVIFVVYTERADSIRIISARRATAREKELYYYGKS